MSESLSIGFKRLLFVCLLSATHSVTKLQLNQCMFININKLRNTKYFSHVVLSVAAEPIKQYFIGEPNIYK